jgi:hypothetical protein
METGIATGDLPGRIIGGTSDADVVALARSTRRAAICGSMLFMRDSEFGTFAPRKSSSADRMRDPKDRQ